MRFWNKNYISSFFLYTGLYYPSPVNFTYFWNFGSLALFFLVSQILTGIFLAMHYVPNVELAFYSVEHITLDVNYGWLIRYMHSNGASMFFLVVYIHLFRGLYYNSFSYPRQLLWVSGVILLFLMIVIAFLGYVLPWGQMSFWAATVITNLVSAVPYIGEEILIWIWGGFSVNNATLNRFFSLHFVLPFILLFISLLHLLFLHEFGSNNPIGITSRSDDVYFNPYYTIKDLYGVILFFILFFYFIFFNPNFLGHSDNYILANPMVTPTHIVPEWYLLPFYAILRSVPNKLLGVIMLLVAIFILVLLPFSLNSIYRVTKYRVYLRFFFWIFFFNCIVLGWIGGKSVEPPYYFIGQFSTFFYFFYFLFILPFITFIESIYIKIFYGKFSYLKQNVNRLNFVKIYLHFVLNKGILDSKFFFYNFIGKINFCNFFFYNFFNFYGFKFKILNLKKQFFWKFIYFLYWKKQLLNLIKIKFANIDLIKILITLFKLKKNYKKKINKSEHV